MSFVKGQVVEIVDKMAVANDELLEEIALKCIGECGYKGEVTKVVDDIHFVGFKHGGVWVTQGFKADEIKGVK